VLFGIKPTGPASGYGYLRPGETTGMGAQRVKEFVEKPNPARAAQLVGEGCLWNSGMFTFRADAGLAEIQRLSPTTLPSVEMAVEEASLDLDALLLGPSFATAPMISFDYGEMEKTERAAMIAADFTWSDIGDWREIWSLSPKDAGGVAAEGTTEIIDVRNSYLRADSRLLCAVGVEDLVVVDTPDALLIARLDRTQEVKQLVRQLESKGRPEAHTPARVRRPWGWYQTTDLGDRFRVKRILISPGKKLSLQRHHHRAEHWVVVRGTAKVTRDSEVITVRENESIYLPAGCVHRLANPGRIPVEIIEVQTGAYLEEDDVVRIEDDFGRC
jgi:mannose-1-phosphate guanylyltransferase/mannose-6-phosphate isomerase